MFELNTKAAFSLRRIVKDIRELQELKELNNDHIYNLLDNTVILNYDNKRVIVQIDNYPFLPPIIHINNNPLIYNSNIFPSRLWKRYIKLYPNNCMCCKTILCRYNWSPCLKLKHILNEYNIFTQKLKLIANILMFERVNLPYDIIYEITSYLI